MTKKIETIETPDAARAASTAVPVVPMLASVPAEPAEPALSDAATAVISAETLETDAAAVPVDARDEVSARPALDAEQPLKRPRIRWAAIVWGLVLTLLSGAGLFVLLNPQRVAGVEQWAESLSATTVTLYSLLALGALVLIIGLTGVLRRLQKRVSAK